eukprot:SAG22_NODE_786_length_7246_cov_3.133762_2_plen_1777_part_00
MRTIPVLSTDNLRLLPEFKYNVFLERLVRIFSETGEQVLTLIEFVDLYSALSRRAPMKWKAWICYCMFDYDEDGVLDQGDLYRSISAMLQNTKQSPPGQDGAAEQIQRAFRGHLDRKKVHGTGKLGAIKSHIKGREEKEAAVGLMHAHIQGPIEQFSKRILSLSTSIRKDVLDYRYFENEMKSFPPFRANFSVNPSSCSRLRKADKELEKRKQLDREEKKRAKRAQKEGSAASANNPMASPPVSSKILNPLMLAADSDSDSDSDDDSDSDSDDDDDEPESAAATPGGKRKKLTVVTDTASPKTTEDKAEDIYSDNAGIDGLMSKEDADTLLKTWLRCSVLATSEDRPASPTYGTRPKNAKAADIPVFVAELTDDCPDIETPTVSKEAFIRWFDALPSEWRLRVKRKRDLDRQWFHIAGESDRLEQWEARALLEATGWFERKGAWLDDEGVPIDDAELSEDKHFEHWWHRYDANENGNISRDEFTIWWVKEHEATHKKMTELDWDAAKAEHQKKMRLHESSPTTPGGGHDLSRVQRQMLKLDSELGGVDLALQGESDFKMNQLLSDDYDSKDNVAKLAKTQAAFGIHGAVRPPMLRTRLKRFKHVQALERNKHGSAAKAQSYADSSTIKTAAGLESVGEMLDDYEDTNGTCIEDARIYIMRHIGSIHVGLWRKSLHELESHFGHGVAELMKIMKFMLTLNMGLGLLWMLIVIVPREMSTGDASVAKLFWSVFGALITSDDSPSSLFYNGYEKTRVKFSSVGMPVRLDVLYFIAIIVNIGYSLSVILRTLGVRLTDLAQSGSTGAAVGADALERDAARDFAALLGAYDMTCKDDDTASHMRQDLRKQMETWVVATEEKAHIEETHKDCVKRTVHEIRLKGGFLITIAMLAGYAWALYQILTYQEVIAEKFTGLAPSLILSVLNLTVPLSIKYIIKLEGHFRSIDILKATMTRIFVVKLVQLTSIMWGLLRIYDEKKQAEEDESTGLSVSTQSTTTGTGNSTVTTEETVMENGGKSYCVERQFGYLFFRLVLTDAMVFSMMQRAKLYLTVHGLPRFWKWYSTVNHWERGNEDVDLNIRLTGYQLQKRVEKRQVGLTMEDVLAGKSKKIRKTVTWWKLMPHKGTSWNQFSTKYKTMPVAAYMRSLHYEKYTDSASNVLGTREEFEQHAARFGAVLELLGIQTMADLHSRNMNAKELAEAVSGYSSGSHEAKTQNLQQKKKKVMAALRIPKKFAAAIATEVVHNEGLWVEVTDDVDAARLHKFEPTKFKNFVSASLMIDVLYRQTFVWIGAVFCPWLPAVAAVAQIAMFISLKHAMLNGAYQRPDEPWSAEQTFKVFMMMALLTLLISMVPTLIWLNTTPSCGPHMDEPPYTGDDGNLVLPPNYMVFETFASFRDDLYYFPADSFVYKGYFVQLISILVNPPCLVIMILIMYARYTFVKTELKATRTEMRKASAKFAKEKNFLSSQLEDTVRKHEGDGGVARMQRNLDRTMRAMDQKELDHLVATASTSRAAANAILDQDGDGHASASELQSFVEFAATIDTDGDHTVGPEEREKWREMVRRNTIWIGNIDRSMATEKHVRATCANRFGEVIAATAKKYDGKREEHLNHTGSRKAGEDEAGNPVAAGPYANCPELLHKYPNRSWALVTFVAAAEVSHASGSEKGSWEGEWDAVAWSEAKPWKAADMRGSLGDMVDKAELAAGGGGNAEAINRHNLNLVNALTAALNLKKEVQQVQQGLFAEDDYDDDLDDLDDDSEQEEEMEERRQREQAKAAKRAAKGMI